MPGTIEDLLGLKKHFDDVRHAHAVGSSLFALRARATEEELSAARSEIEASSTRLDQAHAQARANEALLSDSRARESALLEAMRALGAGPRVSTER